MIAKRAPMKLATFQLAILTYVIFPPSTSRAHPSTHPPLPAAYEGDALAALHTTCRCAGLLDAYLIHPAMLFDTPLSTSAERAFARTILPVKPAQTAWSLCSRATHPPAPCQGVFSIRLFTNTLHFNLSEGVPVAARNVAIELCRRGWTWLDEYKMSAFPWGPPRVPGVEPCGASLPRLLWKPSGPAPPGYLSPPASYNASDVGPRSDSVWHPPPVGSRLLNNVPSLAVVTEKGHLWGTVVDYVRSRPPGCQHNVIDRLVPATYRLDHLDECLAFFDDLRRALLADYGDDDNDDDVASAASDNGGVASDTLDGAARYSDRHMHAPAAGSIRNRAAHEPWYIVKQRDSWGALGMYFLVPSLLNPEVEGGMRSLEEYEGGRKCGLVGQKGHLRRPTTLDAIQKHTIAPWQLIQRYVRDPLLIHGGKFHIRIYVPIPCFDPLVVLFSNEANYYQRNVQRYERDDHTDMVGHVTNLAHGRKPLPLGHFLMQDELGGADSEQHGSTTAQPVTPEPGSKAQAAYQEPAPNSSISEIIAQAHARAHAARKAYQGLPEPPFAPPPAPDGKPPKEVVARYLVELDAELASLGLAPPGHANATLIPAIKRAVVFGLRAMVAGMAAQGGGQPPGASLFQLLAFDFMVDSALQPVLLEVNRSPMINKLSPRVFVDLMSATLALQRARLAGRWPPPQQQRGTPGDATSRDVGTGPGALEEGPAGCSESAGGVSGDAKGEGEKGAMGRCEAVVLEAGSPHCSMSYSDQGGGTVGDSGQPLPPLSTAEVLGLHEGGHLELLVDGEWDAGNVEGC